MLQIDIDAPRMLQSTRYEPLVESRATTRRHTPLPHPLSVRPADSEFVREAMLDHHKFATTIERPAPYANRVAKNRNSRAGRVLAGQQRLSASRPERRQDGTSTSPSAPQTGKTNPRASSKLAPSMSTTRAAWTGPSAPS